MRRVPARDAARCSDRQWDVVVVGAGVALEHWRGLGELLARRKYAQLSAAQRSAAQRSAAQRMQPTQRRHPTTRSRKRQRNAKSRRVAVAHSVGE
jgi:hypothetical protein